MTKIGVFILYSIQYVFVLPGRPLQSNIYSLPDIYFSFLISSIFCCRDFHLHFQYQANIQIVAMMEKVFYHTFLSLSFSGSSILEF